MDRIVDSKDNTNISLQRGVIRGYDVVLNLGDTIKAVLRNSKDFAEDDTNGGIGTVFNGNGAESEWKRREVSGLKRVSGTITFPELNPNARLTRQQADNYVGYGLHELGHMCYSDVSEFDTMQTKHGEAGVAILNALEDPRVEAAVTHSGMAANSKVVFEQVAASIYAKAQSNKEHPYDPNDITWLPVTLSLLGREQYGYKFPEGEAIKARMHPQVLSLVEQALAMMKKAPLTERGTKTAAEAARWLIKELKLPPPPPQQGDGKGKPQQGQGKGKPQRGQAGQGQGDGAEGEAERTEGGRKKSSQKMTAQEKEQQGKGSQAGQEGQGEEQEGEGESGQGQEGEGQGEGKDASDGQWGGKSQSEAEKQEGKGNGQGKGKGEGEGEEGDAEGEAEGKGEGEHADGSGGHGYSADGGGSLWHDIDISDLGKGKKLEEVSPEQAVEAVTQQVNKGAPASDSLPAAMGFDYDARDKGTLAEFKALKASLPSNLGTMRHALWRLLNSRDEAYVDRFREFGRWDTRAFTRMLTGSDSIYRQTRETEGMRSCVEIITDLSGSMDGSPIMSATAACIAVAECLEQLSAHGVSYQICGFEDNFGTGGYGGNKTSTTAKQKYDSFTKWWGDSSSRANGGYTRSLRQKTLKRGWITAYGKHGVHMAGIPIFKRYNENLARARLKLAGMAHLSGGGTPDAAGLMSAIKHVLQRPEPNKIVMVITDGIGQANEIKRICKFASGVGVDVIGLGIGHTQVKSVYPISITAPSLEALGSAAFGKLVQVVQKNRIENGRKVTVV